MNNASNLDPAALERLRKLGGDKFVLDMIRLFLSYVGKKVAETRLAQQGGNLAGMAEDAHAIKSSAGNVGAVRVQDLAARLEQAGREAKSAEVTALMDELERAFSEVAPLLEVEQAKLKPKPA